MNKVFKVISCLISCLSLFCHQAFSDDIDTFRQPTMPNPLIWLIDTSSWMRCPPNSQVFCRVAAIEESTLVTLKRDLNDVKVSLPETLSLSVLAMDSNEVEPQSSLDQIGFGKGSFNLSVWQMLSAFLPTASEQQIACNVLPHIIWFLKTPEVDEALLAAIQEMVVVENLGFTLDILDYGLRTKDQGLALSNFAKALGGEYQQASAIDSVGWTLSRSINFPKERLWFSQYGETRHKSANVANEVFENALYFSWVQPSEAPLWSGNIKRYARNQHLGSAHSSQLDAILDADAKPATELRSGQVAFKSGSRSWWTDPNVQGDGEHLEVGGLASRLKPAAAYTYAGEYEREKSNGWASVPKQPKLIMPDNLLGPRLLLNSDIKAKVSQSNPKTSDQELGALLDWAAGNEVASEQVRPSMGAVLHSGLHLVNYGFQGQSLGEVKAVEPQAGVGFNSLYTSTTDGFFHAFNVQPTDTALKKKPELPLEYFRFMPQELLYTLAKRKALADSRSLQSNLSEIPFMYGLDGAWTVWRYDGFQETAENGPRVYDGLIQPVATPVFPFDDLVYSYAGMRRGGRHLYALDLTRVSTSPLVNAVDPSLLFVIKGGTDAAKGSPYAQLGQTWSQPVMGQLKIQGERRPVIIFGGGYDAMHYDQDAGDTQIGNQVYILDAQTGHLYWTASADYRTRTESHSSGQTRYQQIDDMTFGIASSVKVVDSDADGLTDLIYFGDLGGQIWRIKLNASLGPSETDFSQVQTIFKGGYSWKKSKQQDRRFFYPPSVSFLGEGKFVVSIATGNPARPLDRSVQDGLFVIYDQPSLGLVQTALTPCDLAVHKATDQDSTGCEASSNSYGWKMMFNQSLGERATGSPIVFNYNLFMSTYLPPNTNHSVVASCVSDFGREKVYGLNIQPQWFDQPSGYFIRFELLEKGEFSFEGEAEYPIVSPLSAKLRENKQSPPSLIIKLRNKIIAVLSLPDRHIQKTRWVPDERR